MESFLALTFQAIYSLIPGRVGVGADRGVHPFICNLLPSRIVRKLLTAMILITGPSSDLVNTIGDILRMEGHAVILETNQESALAQTRQYVPSLIVLACPDYDSFCAQFIEDVRKHSETSLIPVLLLSNTDERQPALVYTCDNGEDLQNEISKLLSS